MNRFIDARIPLLFGHPNDADPRDAILREGAGTPTPAEDWFEVAEDAHPIGCACCIPRNSAGQALGRLLLARGRGHGPAFRRVVAVVETEAGRLAVLTALESDPLAATSFKLT